MTQVTFYPIGNADSSLTELADEKMILIDYCHREDSEEDEDKRVDLAEELHSELAEKDRDYFDVVAFTHADNDHVGGSEDFFWLDHDDKYHGKNRIRIRELWIPACFVLEPKLDGSAKVIQQEARYRLKQGKGIRVFARPKVLESWFEENNIDSADREHLVSHAGNCVPGFDKAKSQVELFVHSPFAFQVEGEEVDRNNASLILHFTFIEESSESRIMFGADADHQAWSNIVFKTEQKNRQERLKWDAFKISHHCSYKSLGPEKGKKKTEPIPEVQGLFDRGEELCVIVSSSEPIPNHDTEQRPHMQAANYYKSVASDKEGEFLVTMETPSRSRPRPILIEVTSRGLRHTARSGSASIGGSVITGKQPRFG